MKLYHSTNAKLEKLIPSIGGSRNIGEDSGAIDKAVVYLTNDGEQIRSDENGMPDKYRYTVEVNENYLDLYEDKSFTYLIEMGNRSLGKTISIKWSYLLHEVDIIRTEIWDGEKYIQV
jgi:hypothetical protein